MATLEERVQALEREHAELKDKIELQTITIGALVTKATLERLNEKYDKLFDSLMAHDKLTNTQLAELRNQQTELDGKIVGAQTEMRQLFKDVETRLVITATKDDLSAMDARFDQILTLLNTLTPKSDQ